MEESDFEEIMRVQRMMASRIVEEQETDSKIRIMSIINELVTDKKKIIQKEAVLVEAQAEGFSEKEVERLLESLENDNFILQQQGYLKKL